MIKRANENLIARDLPPLPEGITQHSLRMTCCSLRLAIGEDLANVAEQLGHAGVFADVDAVLDAVEESALDSMVEN